MSKKNKNCLYVGSFDPLHNGHIELIKKASEDFDHVYVAILKNIGKKARTYPKSDMLGVMQKSFDEQGLKNVKCIYSDSNWFPFKIMKKLSTNCLIRGIRVENGKYVPKEYRFELMIKTACRLRGYKCKSYASVNLPGSTELKKRFKLGQDISANVPKPILEYMQEKK